jgi:hypothetical protein
MEIDSEEEKDDLREEVFLLLRALKALQYPGVDELDQFMRETYSEPADTQIPKLRRKLDRVQCMKAQCLTNATSSSSPASSAHATQMTIRQTPSAVPSNFEFKACVGMRRCTYNRNARIANFLHDNLRKSGTWI